RGVVARRVGLERRDQDAVRPRIDRRAEVELGLAQAELIVDPRPERIVVDVDGSIVAPVQEVAEDGDRRVEDGERLLRRRLRADARRRGLLGELVDLVAQIGDLALVLLLQLLDLLLELLETARWCSLLLLRRA